MSYTEWEWNAKVEKLHTYNNALRVQIKVLMEEKERYRKALEKQLKPFNGELLLFGDSEIEGALCRVLDIAREALDCPLPDAEVEE